MKKALFFVSLILLMGSCIKEPDFHSYQVKLYIDFGSDFPQAEKEHATVTLVNQTNVYSLNENPGSDGFARFSGIEPGIYSVTVSDSVAEGLQTAYYSGRKTINVFDNLTDSVKLSVNTTGNFVIKEIYFSGSTTPAGKKYYADQFIEIFNNTNQTQYADGISVLIHESSNTAPNFWAGIKDTIVAEMVWTIPGNGNQYPVLPGKSIVIAQDGINHRDDPNGNPLSPVNLGNADFEFYVNKYNNKDIDVPSVPNMIRDYTVDDLLEEVTFAVHGGSAIAIAKIPGETDGDRKAYLNNHLVAKLWASGSNTSFYPKIADKYIIDAVETVQDEAHAVYKRFTPDLDAGYTYITTGSYSGKGVRRKIKEVVNGRVVYQDTNNSTADFLKDVDPNPKVND